MQNSHGRCSIDKSRRWSQKKKNKYDDEKQAVALDITTAISILPAKSRKAPEMMTKAELIQVIEEQRMQINLLRQELRKKLQDNDNADE